MRKQLEQLNLEDFDTYPIWVNLYGNNDDLVGMVEPMKNCPELSSNLEQNIWCRINCILNNGTQLTGIGMYFCDNGEIGNFSIKNNSDWLVLSLPPSPNFVLAKDGPIPFARKAGKMFDDVFPMIVETELIETESRKPISRIIIGKD